MSTHYHAKPSYEQEEFNPHAHISGAAKVAPADEIIPPTPFEDEEGDAEEQEEA